MGWTPPPARNAVIKAGERLRTPIPAEEAGLAAEDFRIAHEWRAAHLLPLHGVRQSLVQQARAVDADAIVAGRIKRMSSLRKKLQRSRINLWDIQDVAGVRAVMPNIQAVDEVVARFRDGRSKHLLKRCDDYVSQPKESGYRSQHLMMRFQGDDAAFRNRSVEVQVRTRNQHSWATTLEAVGLMRGEDLKGSLGDSDWLRFFALMSSEFAHVEDQPLVPGTPADERERRKELLDLEASLDVVNVLTSYRAAIRGVDAARGERGSRFMISFDRVSQQVTVRPLGALAALQHLKAAEAVGTESVLVEVDGVEALSAAYPNYFMDVAHFVEQLRRTLIGAPKGRSVRQLLDSWRFWKGYSV